jgi:LCP family protein required for cell wall assembly
MRPAYEPYPRGRSPFAAAFLSLIFPGLGHAYLGITRRAIAFAAPPILIGALAAGFAVRLGTITLAGLAVQTWFIAAVFLINLVALAYRGAAILDAWLVARWLARGNGGAMSSGPRRSPLAGFAAPLSIAGLLAVLGVMSLAHIAVARYDLVLAGTTSCVFEPGREGCGGTSPEPGASGAASPTPAETVGPEVSEVAAPTWNGRDRLNILLLGADEQDGAHNTDTMITVSIDPVSNSVVLFTLPRDVAGVPVPAGPARTFFGPTFRGKINGFFSAVSNRPDLFPGSSATRGYNGLKAILGELYGLDIRYFVEVNFEGFEKVVDALGGVTVNVQIPVLDDAYPRPGGILERLYIPAGMQHMTGTQALAYSRSRKTTSDFDRAARQQRVLVSLRNQTDISRILPSIDALAGALRTSIRTDIPRELVPDLLRVAERVGSRSVRSVIFAPPLYGDEVNSPQEYYIAPDVARIRSAVADAFTVDPAFAQQRDAIAAEGASAWVLNGSGRTGEATALAGYLTAHGLAATAPNQRPPSSLATTRVVVYNGAEARLPLTIKALELIFDVDVETRADPSIPVDIVITTGKATPELTPPPAP